MVTHLFVASVKATSGNYEGVIISSNPKESEFEAVEDLQMKAHMNVISADWAKVSVDSYELVGGRVVNPAEEFAEEYKILRKG